MPWFNVISKDDGAAGEIHLYGQITDEKWMSEDVTPADFRDKMATLKNAKRIDLYVNSPGGGVFAGMTIHNMIARHPAEVIAHVDGIAASIASVIVMAADKIHIPKNGMMMIHNPMGVAMGDAEEMLKTAELLEKVKDTIVATYVEHTKGDEKKIRKMMDAETWMTGEEAVELGFADVLEESVSVTACADKAIINGQEVAFDSFRAFPKDRISALQKSVNTITVSKPDFSIYERQLFINSTFLKGVR
jgi:ATP-dependent Clp protease, protease subunit